jgi:hypothetical protein
VCWGGADLRQATAGAVVVLLAMYLFNSRTTQGAMLLPVSQERHVVEKSRPLLTEWTSIRNTK